MDNGLSADSNAAMDQAQPETQNADSASPEPTESMATDSDLPADDIEASPSVDTADDAVEQSTATPPTTDDDTASPQN